MSLQWIKSCKPISREFKIFDEILAGTHRFAAEMFEDIPQYRPFHNNERSSVAMLVAGAAKVGLLPASEHPVRKRTWESVNSGFTGPFNTLDPAHKYTGFADFWVSTKLDCLAAEFKQSNLSFPELNRETHIHANLGLMFDHAREELRRIDVGEADYNIAGLISPVVSDQYVEVYERFCATADWAASMEFGQRGSGKSDHGHRYRVFFYFATKPLK